MAMYVFTAPNIRLQETLTGTACLKALQFPEWNSRERAISSVITGGTWLRSNAKYCEWLQCGQSDLLWIAGKPGSGKSTLAKEILRQLREEHRTKSMKDDNWDHGHGHLLPDVQGALPQYASIVAAFYYSHRGGSSETNHELMLRSILFQFLRLNSRFFHFCNNSIDGYKQRTDCGQTKI